MVGDILHDSGQGPGGKRFHSRADSAYAIDHLSRLYRFCCCWARMGIWPDRRRIFFVLLMSALGRALVPECRHYEVGGSVYFC